MLLLLSVEAYMIKIGTESFLLEQFLIPEEQKVINAIKYVLHHAYWNEIYTRRGHKMSIKITNCGDYGWFSDQSGYYYSKTNPITKQPWPAMPPILKDLAVEAAKLSGFNNFDPDCCLLNRYAIGSKLGLHQDLDEKDFSQPIVSFSLGIPAYFLFGGLKKEDTIDKILVKHGDVIVFGGKDRLRYHGVDKIKPDNHEIFGDIRINLTFRKAH